jgi:hypothetical protein
MRLLDRRGRRDMTNPKIQPLPSYTNDQVASILTRALDRQNDGGRISHDELLETAREIGVTTLEIEASIVEETKQRAARIVREEEQARRVRAFLQHLAAYVVLVAFAFVLDTKLSGGVWWYWLLLAWGAGVGVHAARTFRRPREPEATKPLAPPVTPSRIQVRGGTLGLEAPVERDDEAG